jgi:hypothetical protein
MLVVTVGTVNVLAVAGTLTVLSRCVGGITTCSSSMTVRGGTGGGTGDGNTCILGGGTGATNCVVFGGGIGMMEVPTRAPLRS